MDIALQLYSIKEDCEKDFDAALAMAAQAGYTAVEFAGYYGIKADAMAAMLDKHGLKAVSSHVGFDALAKDIDGEMEYADRLGFNLLVCPWAGFDTLDDVKKNADTLERLALVASAHNFTLGYHNHSHEFRQFDGRPGMDIFLELAPSVQYQPDVCWVDAAGVNAVEYVKKYADRVCAVHAKETGKDGKYNLYVGEGRMDFAALARVVSPESVPYIIEQEDYTSPRLDGITRCYKGLKAKLGK